MPVSYTHLDVYKRQQHRRRTVVHPYPFSPADKNTRADTHCVPARKTVFICRLVMLDAVSYTHLDVYKRQVEVFGGQVLPCLDRLTMFWRKTGLSLRLVAAEKPV